MSLTYRSDIDGLRAIAILSVVIYHAFPAVLPGGFVGVDIFFVISGYLISCIIFKTLAANSFSFLNFYTRRIKRLFPALLVVMFTVFACGWLILVPEELKQLGKHMVTGTAFVQNIALCLEAGYFSKLAVLVGLSLVVLAVGAYTYSMKGFPSRMRLAMTEEELLEQRNRYWGETQTFESPFAPTKTNILVFGDSQAHDIVHGLKNAPDIGLKLFTTPFECSPFPKFAR